MHSWRQQQATCVKDSASELQLAICFLQSCKYIMRLAEIQTIKPIKPLTPAQARLRSLRNNIDNGRKQLQAERDRQRQQRERESARKLQVGAKSFGKAGVPTAISK